MSAQVVSRDGFAALLERLIADGYRVVGPTVADAAVIYDDITGLQDLPMGWTDEQEAGRYRLRRNDSPALFAFTVGPNGAKHRLFPARQPVWRAVRDGSGFTVDEPTEDDKRMAFVGVRSCDLAAMHIQDRVFDGRAFSGEHSGDRGYVARRENALIITVTCGTASGTCFCASMETGPRPFGGYDLNLTEILDGGRHDFVIEVGSERGAALLASIQSREANAKDLAAIADIAAKTTAAMGRRVEIRGLKEILADNPDLLHWKVIAGRCLGCGNCTMVCPTCFCSTIEDTTDLDGDHAERWRLWDSCFNPDHSYIHGGAIRRETHARYRQWLTHKFSTWHDQFGVSGCVGCGRCITWCPVGIDITEEIRAIRAIVQENADD
ncbi:MAG: 4Fe-4S dicluster domain-containing protein [Rhodospirillales bacterium]|nr:4Fe-4S dicluster domain-containing protein [Rhodospirillales bacterium]